MLYLRGGHTLISLWRTYQSLGLLSRGVTVHKIHCSVLYDTVVSRYGTISIRKRERERGGGGG